MKKIILISILIFNSLLAFSKIETVKLVYDKNEVYKGNTFIVKLRVQTRTGKVIYSDVYNRYSCESFKFNLGKGLQIVEKNSDYLKIMVTDSILNNEVDVTWNYFYKPSILYSDKIIIHDFVNELDGLKMNIDSESILSNSIVDFSMTGQISNGLLINVSDSGKIVNNDLLLTVLEGGQLLSHNQIEISNYLNENSQLKIKVEAIGNSTISSVFTFPIICNPKVTVNLSGMNGADGLVGENGFTQKPKYIASPSTVGTNGMNGRVGEDGINGRSILINVDVVSDDRFIDSVLRVDLYEEDNLTISKTYFLIKGKQIMFVNASGGDGGDGGNGGYGGQGSTGFNGGSGGDGNDGGLGADGADVIIRYTKKAAPYKNNIVVKLVGGKGGKCGIGGSIGAAGTTYYSKTDTKVISRGRIGRAGRNGRNGRDGKTGTVHFVLIK
jgi:hypothetical protein